MKSWLLLLLVGLLLASPFAWPISGVGNRQIESKASGFVAQIPLDLCRGLICGLTEIAESSKVIIEDFSGIIYQSGIARAPLKLRLVASEFTIQEPNWVNLDRNEIKRTLNSLGWQALASPNLCMEVWSKMSPSDSTFVATWGRGKGLVLYGPNFPRLNQEARDLIQSIELSPGACAW